MDELIACPRCGSNACYRQEVNDKITNYLCYGCGFISNSLMKDGEIFWEEQFNALPELHKDLVFKDKNDQYYGVC
jgi:transcription initiation factor TFIIIB Brf1 subunit/transcription initiation factor TFIIB